MIKTVILAFALLIVNGRALSQNPTEGDKQLTEEIHHTIQDKNLKLGIAVYDFQNKQTFLYHGNEKFPMQSVYKLPIAIAVLSLVDQDLLQLKNTIAISKQDIAHDLHSPIRDKYPNGVKMPLGEIIDYTVSQSDNTGCDLLISLAGGPNKIASFLKSKGIDQVHVANYEREIQSDWNLQFNNNTTPCAMVELLKKLNNNQLLDRSSTNFLWNVMTHSNTGSVKNLLPAEVSVGYKTGYSGVGANGEIAALNCVGLMKQGSRDIAFAIFITESKESRQVNMDIIAQIGELIYKTYYTPKKDNK